MSDTFDLTDEPARSPPISPRHEEVPLFESQVEPETELQEFEEPEAPSTPTPLATSTMSTAPPTRTVAIIKTHALNHRFDIEHRISEAGFEVRCIPSYSARP